MYTECTVSHLLALFFYAAKKPELHSNKKKAVADDEPRYKSYHAQIDA